MSGYQFRAILKYVFWFQGLELLLTPLSHMTSFDITFLDFLAALKASLKFFGTLLPPMNYMYLGQIFLSQGRQFI